MSRSSRLAVGLAAACLVGCGKVPMAQAPDVALRLAAHALGPATVATISGGHAHADGGYVVDVPAAQARYSLPNGIAYAQGRVYVSDARNNVVTVLADRAGTLFASSFAGAPNPAQDQDGTGAKALFMDPQDLAAGPGGTLFLVEYHTDCIRSLSPQAVSRTILASSGPHPTIWGPYGIAVGPTGALYVSDLDHKQIVQLEGGHLKVLYRAQTARDPVPMGLTVDDHGTVYFSGGYGLYKLVPGGYPEELVHRLPNFAWDLAYAAGHLAIAASTYVVDVDVATKAVTTLAGQPTQGGADGVGAAASFGNAASICFGEPGTLYVADGENRRICRLTLP